MIVVKLMAYHVSRHLPKFLQISKFRWLLRRLTVASTRSKPLLVVLRRSSTCFFFFLLHVFGVTDRSPFSVPNGEVGPLFKASLLDQFRRIRDADRFWFENEDQFTTEEIEMIHGTKLKDIFLRNFPEIIDKVLPTSPFYLAQRQLFFSGM